MWLDNNTIENEKKKEKKKKKKDIWDVGRIPEQWKWMEKKR